MRLQDLTRPLYEQADPHVQRHQMVVNTALEHFGDKVEEIYFHGSAATGKKRPRDYDYLVVMDVRPGKEYTNLVMAFQNLNWGPKTDVQAAISPRIMKDRPGSVLYWAKKEGQRIYRKVQK